MQPDYQRLLNDIDAHFLVDAPAAQRRTPPRRVLVDYGRLSPGAPLTMRHLRALIVGDSVARLLAAGGSTVITDIHLLDADAIGCDDWLAEMQASLKAFGTRFDVWLGESDAAPYITRQMQAQTTSARALCELGTLKMRADDFGMTDVIYIAPEAERAAHQDWWALTDEGIALTFIGVGTLHQPDDGIFLDAPDGSIDMERLLDVLTHAALHDLALQRGARALLLEDGASQDMARLIGLAGLRLAALMPPASADAYFDCQMAFYIPCGGGAALFYALARVKRALNTAAERGWQAGALQPPDLPAEAALIALVARFPHVFIEACAACQPHHIARYACEFADSYLQFDAHCRPARAHTAQRRASWVLLMTFSERILRAVFDLLGLYPPTQSTKDL